MDRYIPRIALVTGASAGIGAAVARRLSALGTRIVLAARREDRLRTLAAELPSPAHILPLDVTNGGAVATALATLPEGFAEVDLLVNAAGGAHGLEPAHEARLEDWDRMIEVNARGVVHVTRALLPGMVARDRGHILHLGSVAGTYPYPGGNVYGATKAFVEQFSLGLRADLAGKRVRVTNIEPGMVGGTEFSVVRFRGDAGRAAAVYKDFPALTPEDIAETVLWCATLPEHVNVNRLEVMSVMQSFAGFSVKRG
jgi:3-hydroxy acid dehydrogenase / malonic semialdehyde reductase